MKKYKTQTEIGRSFGISAIKLGKILTDLGLKDKNGATQKAIEENYAISSQLKDGKTFFVWNEQQIKPLISQTVKPLSQEEIYVRGIKESLIEINRLYESDNGTDHKMSDIMYDLIYDDIPSHILKNIKYKAQFDLDLEKSDVNDVIMSFINILHGEELQLFHNMIKRFYPQYLEKLKIYSVFS